MYNEDNVKFQIEEERDWQIPCQFTQKVLHVKINRSVEPGGRGTMKGAATLMHCY